MHNAAAGMAEGERRDGKPMSETRHETRARRRIRLAVESRGFTLASLDYEPAYDCGEKMGIGGGWVGTTIEKIWPNSFPGDEFGGLSVEECLADIDWQIKPTEACECARPTGFSPFGGVKGWPSRVGCHDEECRWFIRYHLPWWTEHGTDWSAWKPGDTWEEGQAQKPACLCGFQGTPEECEAARSEVAGDE